MFLLTRRQFAGLTAAGLLALNRSVFGEESVDEAYDPQRPILRTGKKLTVQPVLVYRPAERRELASWRSWGPVNTPAAADEERKRIDQELAGLLSSGTSLLEIRPTLVATSDEEAQAIQKRDHDAVMIYHASGPRSIVQACFASQGPKDSLIFARHESGPIYYGYEALSTGGYLKKGTAEDYAGCSADNHGPVTVNDVVIDDYEAVRCRLAALAGLKNFVGHRILALGGAQGKYDATAPQVARDKYRFDIVDLDYKDLGRRLETLRADAQFLARANQWTDVYLSIPGTKLQTDRRFITEAFLLYRIFKDWLRENNTTSITINQCMGTIIEMSRTTACLTLSWLNDEGYLALCESDFVIVPPCVLMRYICGNPVFLHNSTFPHRGRVTCAHCTCPRRLDGTQYEPATIMTHYESDYGAAPKVDLPIGKQVTFISPEFATGRWLGFTGVVKGNPNFEICRSQQEVEIQGQWQRLMAEARDSHWVMTYGDHAEAAQYAARKIGIRWDSLTS